MSLIILSKLILITFSSSSSSESSSPPLEPQRTVTSLPSASITKPITIATSASASSSVTTLEESSPRHFQHPSPRSQQQALVSQVTKVCGKRIKNYVITSLWLFKTKRLKCIRSYDMRWLSFSFLAANHTRANSTTSTAWLKR